MNKINTILNFQEEKQMKGLKSKEKKGKFTIKKLKRQVKGITLIALVVTIEQMWQNLKYNDT